MYIGNVPPNEFYKDKPEVLKKFNEFLEKEGICYAEVADECQLPKRFHIFGVCCGGTGTILCGDKYTFNKIALFCTTKGNEPSGRWTMHYYNGDSK